MKILGLDTSTLMTTCAVLDGDNLIGECSLSQSMSHSEKLVPMVKSVLDSLDLRIQDIDLFATTTGPGSFTGLRIALATIKGFAHIYDKPVVGISTLEALAFNLPYNDIVVPMLDARRNRVYTGIYSWKGNVLKTIMGPDALEIDVILELLDKYNNIVVNGDGSMLYKDLIEEELGNKVKFSKSGDNMPRAVSICEIARKRYYCDEIDDYYSLAPNYLRPSQAERQFQEKR